MEENDKLVETILGKESPAEVKIRVEIEKITKKLQQLDCELGKVKLIKQCSYKGKHHGYGGTDIHLNHDCHQNRFALGCL